MSAQAGRSHARRSAGERREEILTVALAQFAVAGYDGVATVRIAREAGISHPYLFRLFATKRDLFLACCDRASDEIVDVLCAAAASGPIEEALPRMRRAYAMQVQAGRHAMLLPLHALAASREPTIGAHVRQRVDAIVMKVARATGAEAGDVCGFFATALLLNATAALEPRHNAAH
jgi:AcrR family transcriptional regulator